MLGEDIGKPEDKIGTLGDDIDYVKEAIGFVGEGIHHCTKGPHLCYRGGLRKTILYITTSHGRRWSSHGSLT